MSLNDQTKRVHYFHAEASALGGRIEQPFQQLIPVQAPLSLPPVGGFATARVEGFRVDGIVSFEAAYTQVSGSAKSKNGPWSTMVTSVVEGLNVLNIFTADRIVAQLATEHPAEGYIPKVTFAGTKFEGVQIAGRPVTLDVDINICNSSGDSAYPKDPYVRDKGFLSRVAEQYRTLHGAGSGIPDWMKERYPVDIDKRAKDNVVCSIVKGVGGRPGHIFEVPQYGRGFLGELLVDSGTFQLIMLRLDLGCANVGELGFGVVRGNGRTEP
jgi:hypothetical protein